MKIPLVDLKAQYSAIHSDVDAAIARVIGNTSFIMGKEVSSFEEEFSGMCQARYCVGVSSGTSALMLALAAAGVGPGDEVITTPFTFIATAESIWQVGARPVFVDIDPLHYNIDPAGIEAAITERTRAIMPVHLYGQPADMAPITAIARKHGLTVIEDAAQAHLAEYRDRRVGTLGTMACFSFYPGKNLGAYGDAGAVITDDEALAGRVQMLRNHGRTTKYEHDIMAYGERIDALQAAILAAKLPHLEDWTERRRAHAARYNELLAGSSVTRPAELPDVRAVYHLYVVRTPQRDALLAHLKEREVGAGVHYPLALHMQPAMAYLGYRPGDFPQAEAASQEVLSLPLYPEMTAEQLEYVADAVLSFQPDA
jgi:dTDP-4-amino-4,6-dideoxygalactose transaminase